MQDGSAAAQSDSRAVLEQALTAHRAGQFDEAERLYRAVLALNPADHNALTNLGTVALQRGRLAEGVSFIEASLKIKPDQANAINNRGNALMSLGRLDEALEAFERAIALDANNAEAHSNRAVVLASLERQGEAVGSYQRALEIRPDFLDAMNGLGVALQDLGRAAEALPLYDRALELNPSSWQFHYNRGNALRAMNRPQEALEAYDLGLTMAAPNAAVLANRAVALLGLGRYDEAMAGCEAAIAIDQDYVDAQWNKALLLLMKGDYLAGWRQYEWRWRQAQYKGGEVQEGVRWLGQPPIAEGTRILMFYEQGLGDTIQMLRYATVAAERGAIVGVVTPPALKELSGTVTGVAESLIGGEPVAYHFWTPMMSLPMAFGTTLETVPNAVPYIHTPEAAKTTWAKWLGPRTRPRVGLAWSGSATHGNDANRSIALARLKPLLDANAEFISLQVEYREGDRAILEADGRIQDLSGELKSLTDTAAVIEALDLVVTVDTSVAHLAGALGKPLLVLLAFVPDFRWGVTGERTPWYPTAKLLRQPAAGDWDPVVAAVRVEIDALAD